MTAPALDFTAELNAEEPLEQPEGLAADAFDLAAANARAATLERAAFADVFKPRERINVLEWADTRRYMSPEANALAADAGGPVKYSSTTTPYHREILLAL